MKISSRHLAIDMYKCEECCFYDIEKLFEKLKSLLSAYKVEGITGMYHKLLDEHIVVMLAFNEGHMTVHVFPELCYISVDVFNCKENATPESLFNSFRNYFNPEMTKTTLLKRGDFVLIAT